MPSPTYSSLASPSASSPSDDLTTQERRSPLGRRPGAILQIPPIINYKFWFDDLHVALVSLDHVAYRVRRDCLESASRYLAHLIAGATKTADKQSSFGCPIVHLDLPSARLEPFLDVVTDPKGNEKISWLAYRRVHRSSPSDEGRLSFSSLAALARTAHSLRASETKFAALSRIMHFFKSHAPMSFAGHYASFPDNWEWWSRECGIRVAVEDAIEALNLSRVLFAAPRFPLALYACCLLSPTQLRSGIVRADGVVERLSDDDFARCMRALPLLHLAHRDSIVRALPADDWQCLGAHRSAFPCAGRDGVRRIRDVYAAHTARRGRYRPDLRDLLVPLRFKSVPYGTLFALGDGEPPICARCVERLVGISETLCDEEASNLERYFFDEDESSEADNVDRIPAPGSPEARESRIPPLSSSSLPRTPRTPPSPPSSLTPRSPPSDPEPELPLSRSSSPDTDAPPRCSDDSLAPSPSPSSRGVRPPSPSQAPAPSPARPESGTSSPSQDDSGESRPGSPVGEDPSASASEEEALCSPQLEIGIPRTIGALGWHEDDVGGSLLFLLGD